jgi:ATP-dependent Clp protease ATP-binding subunit ClpC
LVKEHVVSVSKAIRRARVGLRIRIDQLQVLYSLDQLVTELTKALSEYMFGTEESMIRLDMSEYMEKHTVAKINRVATGLCRL